MEMALTRIIYIFKQEKSLAATEEERTYLLFCTNHIVVYSLRCLVSAYTLEDVLWPISDLKKEKWASIKIVWELKKIMKPTTVIP